MYRSQYYFCARLTFSISSAGAGGFPGGSLPNGFASHHNDSTQNNNAIQNSTTTAAAMAANIEQWYKPPAPQCKFSHRFELLCTHASLFGDDANVVIY